MAVLRHLKNPSAVFRRLLPTILHRRFAALSAAAQPLIDPYDYYYHEDDHFNSLPAPAPALPEADSDGWVPERGGARWLLIGCKPKHAYGEKLSKLLEVPHISITSLLRQDLNPQSSLYKQIADAVNQGTIVPQEIIFRLLSKRLEDGHHRGEAGFILDGIPRTKIQAEILDKLVDIDLVINFKIVEDDLLKIYRNSIAKPHDFSVDAKIFTPRLTDRLHIYAEQIKPLEEYFKNQKKLLNIRVSSAPGETWKGLLAALHLQYVNAARSTFPAV